MKLKSQKGLLCKIIRILKVMDISILQNTPRLLELNRKTKAVVFNRKCFMNNICLSEKYLRHQLSLPTLTIFSPFTVDQNTLGTYFSHYFTSLKNFSDSFISITDTLAGMLFLIKVHVFQL